MVGNGALSCVRSAVMSQRVSMLSWVVLVSVLAFSMLEIHTLREQRSLNAALMRGDLSRLAQSDAARGILARAIIAEHDAQFDEAISAYSQLGEQRDERFRDVVRFNLANLYLARAVAAEKSSEKQLSSSLIEQAKQNYREVLARNPMHWDARYNLSRALEMLPDLEDVHYGDEVNPERSPQSPKADTAYERLP